MMADLMGSSDLRRLELEKTCVSLITHFAMKGSIANKLAAVTTKGLVVSKSTDSKEEDSTPRAMNNSSPTESSVDPPTQEISRLVDELAENKELPPASVVPSALPQDLRGRAPSLHQEDLDVFFNVEGNRRTLESGQLSSAQLISLYMLAFRNMLEYDLDGVQEMRDRFIRYLANVLADVMEMCYPIHHTSIPPAYDERLLQDLRKTRDQRQ